MILIPNIDGCTIITNNGFCSILGHPFDIVPSLFVKRDKIDDTTTLISKTVKEVSVYYIELLKNLGIDVKVIPQKHPSKIFKEVR